MQTEGPRWECIYCGSVMDKTNLADFIKQSDDDKNSVREARVQYHTWPVSRLDRNASICKYHRNT